MARKEPTPATIKKLFAFSGNQCAFPNCTNSLIDASLIIGEICHIEAAEKGGKRYNANSTDEQRRDFSNLILLCPICHKKIDSDENEYSVDKIESWKKNHEEKFRHKIFQVSDSIVEQTIQKYMEQKNINIGNGMQINTQAKNINIENQIGIQNIYQKSKSADNIIDYGEGYRKVIVHFKNELDEIKKNSEPIEEKIINFRNNVRDKKKSKVFSVPIKLLRFRKENGRIKSEVKSYEKKNNCQINEINDQNILKNFLLNNDKGQTERLKTLIANEGQREPAIITCDGFLINGNRRRAVFQELWEQNHQDTRFETMNVVILDEKLELIDIEKIENRYQLQDEGKSEYSGLNRALSIRDKIDEGYTLEAQLKDDPLYKDKKEREFNKVIKEYKENFLYPLECADEYLAYFDNEGLYDLISEAIGSSDGRWQAFIEYSKLYYGILNNDAQRRKVKIAKEDVSKIKDIAFKLIRKRELGELGSLYKTIRNLKKYVSHKDARSHLFKIVKEVDTKLPVELRKNTKSGQEITKKEEDKSWGTHFSKNILGNLHQAHKLVYFKEEQEKPIELLKQALKKLEHDNLNIKNINMLDDINEAIDIARKIQNKAEELEKEMDKYRYQLKKGLKDHFNGN